MAYSHSNNPHTPYQYRRSIGTFCQFINKSPEEIIAEYNLIDEKVFRRNYAQYLKAFIAQMSQQGYAPNSINLPVVAVKSFFKYSDLPIGFVPKGSSKVLYHNRAIQKEEILAVLAISKPREKAFYTMLAQSGLRPDTLCKLTLGSVEPDFSRFFSNHLLSCLINVKDTETKGAYGDYFSFMGEESVKALTAYFTSSRKQMTSDSLLFTQLGSETEPANPKSFSALFTRALRQLLTSGTINYKRSAKFKQSELRMYTLRKYFRNHVVGEDASFPNFWMGHLSALGVDLHYFGQDTAKHRETYEKCALPNLRLESSTPNEAEKVMIEKSKEVDDLKNQIAELTETVNVLKRTVQAQWTHINQQNAIATPEQNNALEEEVRLKTIMKAKGITAAELLKAISNIPEQKSE